MIIIGRHLIRKVLNNYIYMISTTTIDKNKILTKNIISNNITCNGCLIFKYATENVSIGLQAAVSTYASLYFGNGLVLYKTLIIKNFNY